jgi:formylglycine-generating enzyme required for sulfatase activity
MWVALPLFAIPLAFVLGGKPRALDPAHIPTAPAEGTHVSEPSSGDDRDQLADERPVLVEEPTGRPTGMVWIPGGRFAMGAEGPGSKPDEGPVHSVVVDGFWMDEAEVTNRQFAEFADATGYVTLAEKPPSVEALRRTPGYENAEIKPEFNKAGSICYRRPAGELDEAQGAYNWWTYIPGANWRHPDGPESDIADRLDHPVVHVAWDDCVAYAKWAGKQLPTEAQWEYAARAGIEGAEFPWGTERNPDGKWLCNIWQGDFPYANTGGDGFRTTAPVKAFPANKYGLFDMSGNVWEWCADNYQPKYYAYSPARNPAGPGSSHDPDEPGIPKRVQRGGSFMCSETYCTGYRVSARMKGEQGSGVFHTGFRCVRNPPSAKAAPPKG